MTKPLWKPSAAIANSNMQQFIDYLENKHNFKLKNYLDLYNWSITDPKEFWIAIWNFCQVKSSKLWEQPLIAPDGMFGAKWFSGALLNFAENLLKRRDNKIAIIFQNEQGQRRTLTFQQLYNEVAKLAWALRQMGVIAGDRVAAFLPNMPEAVIAMLATTSIGAIWSSCSPDFGVEGVLNRFGQIAPKVLLTADGHHYNGKTFNDLEKISVIAKQLPSLKKIIVIPYLEKFPNIKNLPNAILYPEFIDNTASTIDFAQLPFNHPAFILYSSGTTGIPKGIVHGAGGTLLQLLKELVLHTDLTEKDIFCYYTTCGWMMWNYMLPALALGTTLVLFDGSPLFPQATTLFDLIDKEKITVFGTNAKYISMIEKNNLAPINTHNLSSLKTILSTGSPLLPQNFDYVYQKIKHDVRLSSISGGTDIISCFVLGNPLLPVYRGEIQCIGLGMKVEIFNPVIPAKAGIQDTETQMDSRFRGNDERGELVCTAPFPSMPIYFWNDPDGKKYHKAYFEKFPGVWAHGDYAATTAHHGIIIYGRADATLNPGGIRIGTAEIYRQVEKIAEILESIAVAQEWQDDTRIILFVQLRESILLNDKLRNQIKAMIRENVSPHHVPAKIIQVKDIPRTINGKITELAVREIIHGREVPNISSLANPESLNYFKNLAELAA